MQGTRAGGAQRASLKKAEWTAVMEAGLKDSKIAMWDAVNCEVKLASIPDSIEDRCGWRHKCQTVYPNSVGQGLG